MSIPVGQIGMPSSCSPHSSFLSMVSCVGTLVGDGVPSPASLSVEGGACDGDVE